MTLRVEVTAEDIAAGRPWTKCPVKMALDRVMPGMVRGVGHSAIKMSDGTYRYLQHGVHRKIAHYDRTGEMEPFGFDLEGEDDGK